MEFTERIPSRKEMAVCNSILLMREEWLVVFRKAGAEQTYGDHDHDHDDEADWDDDFGDAGIMDDDGMTGAYPGFN